MANFPVLPFDGDWEALHREPEESGDWGIDVGYLIDRFPRCRFLSLGAGGGMDVLQALEQGAAEVHAMEGPRAGYPGAHSSWSPALDFLGCGPFPGEQPCVRAGTGKPEVRRVYPGARPGRSHPANDEVATSAG